MWEEFERYLEDNIPGIMPQQTAYICALSTTRSLKRKEIMLYEGEVAQHKIFVMSGLLRMYNIAEDGSEHIIRFSPEKNWCVNPDSFWNHAPSKLYIDALEPSTVVLWRRDSFEAMKATIPGITHFSELLMARNAGSINERVLMSISGTPEEKYRYFIDTYPEVFPRVPLHMIASYLGISRETLTRVRQSLAMVR